MAFVTRAASAAAIQRALAAATAENAGEVIDAVEASVRLDLIEGHWARLQECHFEIVGAIEQQEELGAQEQYLANAEEVFMRAKTQLRRFAAVPPAIAAGDHVPGQMQIDLLPERCKIEPFHGDYAKWQEFRDMFRSLVHGRNISNVQKLQLLKSAVKGDAASVLGSWQMSGDNYEPAWQALVDVYEDEYLIIKAHLDRLFSLPNIISDTYAELRTAIDTTNEVVRSLQVLGVAVQHWDTILVYMIESRLRYHLKEAWDLRRPADGLPTLQDMLAFLSARARAKANASNNFALQRTRASAAPRSESGESSKSASRPAPAKQARKEPQCLLCKGPHGLHRCQDFRALSLRGREEKVQAWRLCGNCLHSGHRASECKSGDCRTCQQPHNSVLCPVRAEGTPTVASVVVRVPDAGAAETSDTD